MILIQNKPTECILSDAKRMSYGGGNVATDISFDIDLNLLGV